MTADDLHALARANGIDTEFTDWRGERREVPDETVQCILGALGVDAADPASAIAEQERMRRARMLPPTLVAVAGSTATVRVLLPEGGGAVEPTAEVRLEGGGRRAAAIDASGSLTLPDDLPVGYHEVRVRAGAGTASATLIVPPARLDLPEALVDRPGWGLAVQLYSVRGEGSWGVGDLGELRQLVRASAAVDPGADFVLVNPLHAAEPVPPLTPSPYLPASRRFGDPAALRVELLPEYVSAPDAVRTAVDALAAEAREAAAVGERLEGTGQAVTLIDRDAVWEAKRPALRLLFEQPASSERAAAFSTYRTEHADALAGFTAWRVLAAVHGGDARGWPEELRDPDSPAVAAALDPEPARDELAFEAWLQFALRAQQVQVQAEARAAGMAVGVMQDLAVGVHPGGADAWRAAGDYATGFEVGAPPDAFNQLGQNWHQPPWRPDRLAELGYAPFREVTASLLAASGALRIDHIIGLFRLWWVPEGGSPADGTYVRYDHEAMVGVLAIEAQRAGAVIVGEDLGVVEASARTFLGERDVLGTSILWFERDDAGDPLPAERWRRLCLASVTTHDLPPTAGYLRGEHVALRERLGLLTRPVEEERAADEADRAGWMAALVRAGLLEEGDAAEGGAAHPDAVLLALHRYLAGTPAVLRSVALTDVAGDRRTQNQPGTLDEYPNWRIPLAGPDGSPIALEQVLASPRLAELARAVTHAD